MKRTIGILLDHKVYEKLPSRKTGFERIHLYNKAAKELQLKPFYMSLNRMGKSGALGYTYTNGRYKRKQRAIPEVTHNRAITLSPRGKRNLKRLAKSSIVYNRKNRYSKYRIYKQLYQNRALRRYLPYSMKYSVVNLVRAMKEYSVLFIKPTSGSVGIGIIKIKQQSNGNWKLYWKKRKPSQGAARQIIAFIKHKVGKQAYLIQEGIPLATFQGRPYDLRVSVQRGKTGEWQVTGIVGKVAAKGRHVTNVAQGGKVKRCEELFRSGGLSAESTKKELQRVSLEIANYLGRRLSNLADIGLDMGIDHKGAVKFIEMNGRDQRYSFKKAGMHSTFYNTYLTPLQYGSFLMNPKLQYKKKKRK
ncbi:hypothetical protein GC093_08775 [Paenibacillus sp. LMG 31456]|uniref:YheC/YheD family protein n=1 Tax=Paenibacillus foliorum TaxID=2654974 RepID=A0A972JY95_9BACL|nr:YheC/YheD family protein [Paenibacillus foliorum]NOU93309.1 hypothetical protein [Paenibacillus foliorum]